MELKQVALVADQLDPVREQLFVLLGLQQDYADPGVGEFGLCNSVMATGDTFLEVVSPMQPGTAAGRLLERRGGDGGYMVLFGVDDIEACTRRMARLGIRKVWNTDTTSVKAFHVHPRDIGAAIVSFDQMLPPDHWEWAGPGWQDRPARHVSAIRAVDIQSDNPVQTAEQWSLALAKPVTVEGESGSDGKYVIRLDRGAVNIIRATDGRGDGVAAVEFGIRDAEGLQRAIDTLGLSRAGEPRAGEPRAGEPRATDEVVVCGTRFRFRQD